MAGPTTVERLTHHLFGAHETDPLADELTRWLRESPRFRRFVETHRAKIRKKLRGASDAGSRRGVRAELAVARLLLADRRFDLEFEAYGATKGGPDFTASFRERRAFNLEVTTLQRTTDDVSGTGPLLAKLRQLPPSMPNVVLLAVEGPTAAALDVGMTVRALRTRADTKDEAFFTRRDLAGTRGFYERLLRLGSVIVWCEAATTARDRASLWVNRSARIPVPDGALDACLACLAAA